eukprot:TRINITY_DN24302_c0_g1_i1.p1 TRINITY_DN24302_c0_g1~~TRINITY_DN24302_c0_g1_i1.p1  ORF type:complete len:1188 (+),score=233.04 TRINITY_DN24302_c0_g1_i1:461-3565(+)
MAFVIRWVILLILALRGDTKFWVSEKQQMKLLFLPAERRWRELSRRGQLPTNEEAVWNPMDPNFLRQTHEAWIRRAVFTFTAIQGLKGKELFLSLEIRELVKMRDGERNGTYERFVESMNEKENAEKIQFAKMQQQIAMAALPAPEQSGLPERRAAWPDVAALADSEESWRNRPEPMALANTAAQSRQRPPSNTKSSGGSSSGFNFTGVTEAAASRPVVGKPGDDGANTQAALRAAAGMPDEAPLPPGWEAYISEDHGGRVFYVCHDSGESSWERPALLPDGSIYYQQVGSSTQGGTTTPSASIGGKSDLPPLRAPGKKFGTLKGSVQALHRLQEGNDSPSKGAGGKQLRQDGRHGAAPPISILPGGTPPGSPRSSRRSVDANFEAEESEGEDFESPSHESAREVPPQRRLPLFQPEALHTAPPPPLQLGNAGNDDDEGDEDEEDFVPLDSVRDGVQRSQEAANNSQEVVLPAGWDLQISSQGREFYVNLGLGLTQWEPPRLPPHWEERYSRSGKLYYLSLFDGRTQWEWPTESKNVVNTRKGGINLSDFPNPNMVRSPHSPMMALTGGPSQPQLALPGAPGSPPLDTQQLAVAGKTGTSLQQLAEDQMSDASSDSSEGAVAMDQVDARALLEVAPGSYENADDEGISPRSQGNTAIATLPKEDDGGYMWGSDPKDLEWIDLKKKMHSQKQVHDERWATAKEYPGVREFIRPYEMHDQMNNWDRQLDKVTLKMDNMDRRSQELGHRAELNKEELRSIFPIIQRLTWTKWGALEIIMHCIIKQIPTQRAFFNEVRPTKSQRVLLHVLCTSTTWLTCCLMVASPATVNENITATQRATWTLLGEAITMPMAGNVFTVAIIAHFVGHFIKWAVFKVFFTFKVAQHQPPTTSAEARKFQLRYWHELSEMGKWTCVAGSGMAVSATLSLCALTPQPRAGSVLQAYFFALLGGQFLYPIFKGICIGAILIQARISPIFDGLLTFWPELMCFRHVGIKTPEFLAWRMQRIVAEEQLLLQIYPDLPRIPMKLPKAEDDNELR